MDQRARFIRDHRLDLYTMAELYARYGISRKTGYKWLAPRRPDLVLPAVSTAGDLLARCGLIPKRRRRRHSQHPGVVPIEYPGHFLVKLITSAGTFRFTHRLLFLSHALEPHSIGLEEVDDGIWSIHFCRVLLGRFDERDYVIRP